MFSFVTFLPVSSSLLRTRFVCKIVNHNRVKLVDTSVFTCSSSRSNTGCGGNLIQLFDGARLYSSFICTKLATIPVLRHVQTFKTLQNHCSCQTKMTTATINTTIMEHEKMTCKSPSTTKQISVPDHVRGMTTLDREKFRKMVQLPFVMVHVANVAKLKKTLNPYMIRLPCFKPVQHCVDQPDCCRMYLNPDKFDDTVRQKIVDLQESLLPLPQKSDDRLIEASCTTTATSSYVGFQSVELKYENFSHHDIFRAILPEDVESISGFSTVGHIIHLNLREQALPYKHLIGQVLLDRNKSCRLVVNKLNIIENEFRNFAMEILAQETQEPPVSTVVDTSESEIRFKFDFAKVYWNPRLSAERTRIQDKMAKEVDVLYDVFAGVGPFAVTVAKFCKCRVLANDLNPDSYHWLCENVRLNKVTNLVECFNLDGREFITTHLKNDLVQRVTHFDGSDVNRRYHVVMNLPALAWDFLNTFDGLLQSVANYEYKIYALHVHCYCFVKNMPENEQRNYVIAQTSAKLGHRIETDQIDEVFNVRKVAPNKFMYRISFTISSDILYGKKEKDFPSQLADHQNDATTNAIDDDEEEYVVNNGDNNNNDNNDHQNKRIRSK